MRPGGVCGRRGLRGGRGGRSRDGEMCVGGKEDGAQEGRDRGGMRKCV